MSKAVLLIVDMQNALVQDRPYNINTVLSNIKDLVASARQCGTEIIYIQHDGGSGDELEIGTEGWGIADVIAPIRDEKVFAKQRNSAFKGTVLHAYLQEKEVERIILVGMQTEYCIDATCKSAFDLDYSIIIPEDCTTTFDNDYFSGQALSEYYEKKIWHNRFANVAPVKTVIADMMH